MSERYVVLCDVRSAHNVGAIFRTADAAGVQKLFLTGYTPTPIDRFGRPDPKIEKTSLGASRFVRWESVPDPLVLLTSLRSQGVKLVAVEQSEHAASLFVEPVVESVAYVFGNEVDGVSAAILEMVDVVVELPMLGQKESLNVAVTAGIVLYHDLFRRQ